jgi:F0F1-type ATP synthase membrane subunit b/b'
MLQQSNHPALKNEIDRNTSGHYIPDNFADRQISQRSPHRESRQPQPEFLAILAAIQQLEETILKSPHVPLTGKTMVREEELLEQLDLIRLSLPEVVATAQEIIQYKDQLIGEAYQQVQQILADANQRAYQVTNELGIIERSEQEARQIRQMAIAECDQLRHQAMIEAKTLRDRNLQELDQVRTKVTIECEQIQDSADQYADGILKNMEKQLADMLQSIQRDRQRLNQTEAVSVTHTRPVTTKSTESAPQVNNKSTRRS